MSIPEHLIERMIDRAVMYRLSIDSTYLNAEDAESQARREAEIEHEEEARIIAEFGA